MNQTLGHTVHVCYLSKSLQSLAQKVPAGTSKWQCQDKAPEGQLQKSNFQPPTTLQGHLWCHLASFRMRNSTDSMPLSCLLCFYLTVLPSLLRSQWCRCHQSLGSGPAPFESLVSWKIWCVKASLCLWSPSIVIALWGPCPGRQDLFSLFWAILWHQGTQTVPVTILSPQILLEISVNINLPFLTLNPFFLHDNQVWVHELGWKI